MLSQSLSPGFAAADSNRSNPAFRQTSSRISTMNVDSFTSYGYACTCMIPCGVSRMKNLNASYARSVASQMNLHRSSSIDGRNVSR
jgi:hypothetical protein